MRYICLVTYGPELGKILQVLVRGAESAGKMKNFPVRQKYFQKMSLKGKMFSSRETFFPRKKKKFFKNFPQIHKFSKFSPYGRTRTRVDSAPLVLVLVFGG